MKKFGIIFLVMSVVLAAGCAKNIDTEKKPLENAWIYDESLPVPVHFGMSGLDVKVRSSFSNRDDMLGKNFGVIAIDVPKKSIFLDDEPVTCVKDEDRYVFQFDEPKYYPYLSENNFSFISYFRGDNMNEIEYGEERVILPISKEQWGRQDLMWSRSDAKTLYVKHLSEINPSTGEAWGYVPAEKDVDATAYYDGFNAAYIRYIAKEKPEGSINHSYAANLPSLNFTHATTNIRIKAVLDKINPTDYDITPVIKSVTLEGEKIYTGADLILLDYASGDEGVLDVSNYSTGKLSLLTEAGDSLLNVTPDTLGVVLTDGFFIQPLEENSPLTLTVEIQVGDENLTLPLEINEHVEFKAGHFYTYELRIYRKLGMDIEIASVAPWKDGWEDAESDPDSISDSLGEDDEPSEM